MAAKKRCTYQNLICAVTFLALANFANAQVSVSIVKYKAPVTVNFSERVMYELNYRDTASFRPVSLRDIEQGEDRENFKIRPKPVRNIKKIETINLERARNANAPQTLSPPAALNIPGIMDSNRTLPPDINGAAGTNFVMETSNQFFSIYKKNGTLVSSVLIPTIFNPAGGRDFFDPHIVFDPSGRHFIIAIDGNLRNKDQGFFLAISKTDDPTKDWYVYGIDGLGNRDDFLDYDQLGFNSKWIVLTGNDFLAQEGNPNQAKIFIFDKKSLYSGSAGTVTRITDSAADLISPASTYDTAQQTEYLVSDWNGDSAGIGFVRISTITGSASQPVYKPGFTLGIDQPWSQNPVNAPQRGNVNLLETGDTRIHSCTYRNNSLWFTHTVFLPAVNPTFSAVDWWEVDPSGAANTQFGRISDPSGQLFYYSPSLDVNTCNDMLIGFSLSGKDTYAGAEYALRPSGDANIETPVQFVQGLAGYYKTGQGTRNRWGDYSGTSFDPVDNSFWTFQQWANTNNNWGTQIANVKPQVCYLADPNGITYDPASQKLTWLPITGASAYTIRLRDMTSNSDQPLLTGKGYSSITSTKASLSLASLHLIKKHDYQIVVVAFNSCCTSGLANQASEIKITY